MPLPVPEDAPFYIKDYSEYYKGDVIILEALIPMMAGIALAVNLL